MAQQKFIDTNIVNKSKTVEANIQLFEINKKILPLPTEIEISESGTCNRTCSFCPRSDPSFEDKKEFISNDLHEKLCRELKEVNYKGTIRYSGFVEPLLVEFSKINNYKETLTTCHSTVGAAILNTSITIVFGFSILVLSKFIPTIYFGVFTGLAMLLAMISVLTLLPSLILVFKPFGK